MRTFCQRIRHTTLDMLSAQSLMRNPKDIPGDGCPPAFCSASRRPPQYPSYPGCTSTARMVMCHILGDVQRWHTLTDRVRTTGQGHHSGRKRKPQAVHAVGVSLAACPHDICGWGRAAPHRTAAKWGGREGYLVGLPDGGGGAGAVVGLAGHVPERGQAAGRQQQHAGQQRQQRDVDDAEAVVADHHAAEARAEGEREGARDELHKGGATLLPSQAADKADMSGPSAHAAPGVSRYVSLRGQDVHTALHYKGLRYRLPLQGLL